MTIQVDQIERVFLYNGAELPDPGAHMSVDEVRDLYAVTFPELTSATVDGPSFKGDKQIYEFRRAAGSKG